MLVAPNIGGFNAF